VGTALLGIHHVTAIAGDPQSNIDFYTGVLGLRLVKQTINFDDPQTYHFYYGDGVGRPGTILTFFPIPSAAPGRLGAGQAAVTALCVPTGSLAFWQERLAARGVAVTGPEERFGEEVLSFTDPDGLLLELVTAATPDSRPGWARGGVPGESAIRGIHSVTLWEAAFEPTVSHLTADLGFREASRNGERVRYATGSGAPGAQVDVVSRPHLPRGVVAAGSVHHVAWRTPDAATQFNWQQQLFGLGRHVTPVQDRMYFRSIYFREPGGVLFEIATDSPGFAVDQPVERLGTALMLPPWLEPSRQQIEAALPPIRPVAPIGEA